MTATQFVSILIRDVNTSNYHSDLKKMYCVLSCQKTVSAANTFYRFAEQCSCLHQFLGFINRSRKYPWLMYCVTAPVCRTSSILTALFVLSSISRHYRRRDEDGSAPMTTGIHRVKKIICKDASLHCRIWLEIYVINWRIAVDDYLLG